MYRTLHCHKCALGFLALCLAVGCASVPDPTAEEFVGREMWTATNLHLVDGEAIYWQNYLSAPILPVGTALRIVSVDTEKATLIDTEDRTLMLYWRGEGEYYGDVFAEEVHKYLVGKNPEPELAKLSEEERNLVSLGELRRGMSKNLVLLSRGWPINVADPEKKDTWIYWVNENKKQAVRFADGVVVETIYANVDNEE